MLDLLLTPRPSYWAESPIVAQFGFGAPSLDRRLHGGLDQTALHEIITENQYNAAAATAVALLLALRGAVAGKPIILLREDRDVRRFGRLYAPSLIELGMPVDSLLQVTAASSIAVLQAGADAIKSGAVGAVVIATAGRTLALDLTASRRLALVTARMGLPTLLLRLAAEPTPSAAQTRWQVTSAPSTGLAENAPGLPAFDLNLLRHRGGIAPFSARVEWDSDQRCFRDAPLFGAAPSVAGVRAAAAP